MRSPSCGDATPGRPPAPAATLGTSAERIDAASKLVLKIGLGLTPPAPAVLGSTCPSQYPSAALALGPRLVVVTEHAHRQTTEVDLTEEGVGLGVPVVRHGSRCRYPSSVRVQAVGPHAYRYTYHLDLTDRVGLFGGRVSGAPLDRAREWFSLLHRRRPATRRSIDTLAALARRFLGVTTWFGPTPLPVVVDVVYRVDPSGDAVEIEVDAREAADRGYAEVSLMNESGGRHFTQYRDDTGFRRDDAIGSWREVAGNWAAMGDPQTGAWFAVRSGDASVTGSGLARLYAGRELAEGRLAWAGVAVVLPPGVQGCAYRVSYGLGGIGAAV
ncbi:MAG: hypothetical protein ACYC33_10965 [Thermoleophilia bacterium]